MLFTNSSLSEITCFSCGRVTNCSSNTSSCSFILVSCDILYSNRRKVQLNLIGNTTHKVIHFYQSLRHFWDFTNTWHLTTGNFFPFSWIVESLICSSDFKKQHVKKYLPFQALLSIMLLWWVDCVQLSDAHLAAFSVPLNRLWRRISGVVIKKMRSLTNYDHTKKHTQKNFTEFTVNYSKSWIVRKKGKNYNISLHFSSSSTSFLHFQHYLPLLPAPWGKGELQV